MAEACAWVRLCYIGLYKINVITSSVSQVRIPKFVRVLYGVRSVSQTFFDVIVELFAVVS